MTPFQIDILLHYHCCGEDWRNGDHSAPICDETFAWFVGERLLTRANLACERFPDGKLKAQYEITDRGRAYVKALTELPLPIQIWIVPSAVGDQSCTPTRTA